MPPLLEVRNARLSYDDAPALRDVSLEVAQGEIFAVIGPSGCGKTSLLRVIAGLEPAQSGEVWLDGVRVDATPTHRRGIGLMFQELALFPHLDVAANVDFGLRMQGLDATARAGRVAEMLQLVGLPQHGARKVHELSGGERQRVALARSLAPRPRLLMLDEPVGALDRALREDLLAELGAILRSQRLTAIYVTHDQEEAFALADRVLVMQAGEVRQVGPPQEIYRAPADAWVARFLGRTNLIPGQVQSALPSDPPSPSVPMERGRGGEVVPSDPPSPSVQMERGRGGEVVPSRPPSPEVRVHTPIGDFILPTPLPTNAAHGPVTLLLGDERAHIERAADLSPALNTILGVIVAQSFHGRLLRLSLRAGEHELSFAVDPPPPGHAWLLGESVRVTLDPAAILIIPDGSS